MSLEEAQDSGGGTKQSSASRKLIVQPSTSKAKEDEKSIELQDLENGEASTPAVLREEDEPTKKKVRVSESNEEDVVVLPSKKDKKKSWKFWQKDNEEDDEYKAKPVPVYKLFRYATWFDLILIIISFIAAILHGSALPGAMYVFGDITNLFANHEISREVFGGIRSRFTNSYQNITFNETANIADITEAVDNRIITPNVVQNESQLTDLNILILQTYFNTNISASDLEGLSCVVFSYANTNVNGLNTPFLVLQEIATNNDFSMPVTTDACRCLQTEFQEFNSESRCLSDYTFIHGEGGVDGILWIIYLFLIITVGVFVFAYIQISSIQLACERQIHKIRLLYYSSVLKQEIGWFDLNPSGELSSRLNDDIDKIHDGIGDKLSILIQLLATFVAGFLIGFIRGWQLTLLLIGVTPFLVVSAAIFSKIATTFTSHEQKLYASAGAIAEEVLTSVRTVISFGGEFKEVDRYKAKLADARRVGAKKGSSVGLSLGLVYFMIFSTYAAAFWFGGFLISKEILLAGDMLAVFFSVIIGAFSLGQAGPNAENLITAAGAAGEVFETIDREPPIDSSSNEGQTPDNFEPFVKFQDVCFTYPARTDVQVLHGLDLEVKVGQTVALVGPSGCGKSTVVQLIQRFYDISGGEITIGGFDIKDLNLKWLRSNIGVVSQEPVLFDTTIGENIRYGREDATMADIEAAAIAANAHNFISELPDGYNTLVGDKGTQLSGGQKQRIAIARAIVRNPKILLLDEATSALDTESEKIVQEALDKARKGRTTIVIAHRLSTIQTADVIAGIDNGRVVEIGTHEDLMKNQGLYYELVNAQSYGDTGEAFAIEKNISRRSTRRRTRTRKTSESRDEPLVKKSSVRIKRQSSRQTSTTTDEPEEIEISEKRLEKLEEEWDKDIPEVSLLRVLKANANEWWLIGLGLLGSLVLGSVFPAFAIFFGEILDVFTRPADQILDALHPWAGLFLVLGTVSGIAVFLKSVCMTIAGENLTARLREWSFKTMLQQEIAWFDEERNSSGILATRLSQDASRVQGATGARLGTLIESFLGMILAVIIALVYSWMLTLVLLLLVPFLIIAGFLQLKAITGHAGATKKALEQAGKIAVDSMENMRTVASLGIEQKFYDAYNEEIQQPFRRAQCNTSVYGLSYGFSQGIQFLGFAMAFGFGAYQVTRQPGHIAHESFSDVFTVFLAIIFGSIGAGQASSFAPNYAKAKQSANRIFALLDREPVIDGYSEEGLKPDKFVAQLELRKVAFNYPARPDVPVLQSLTVDVKPGNTLALVGPSGSGKSTVVALIERFYDPLSGSLFLHEYDLRDLNIRWLRSQIGIVSQEPVLFDTSIADNIRYGANFREVPDEEVIEAAKAANIHNFIETLPQGYATNVGSKGTQLSGGQKQRIAIARALVRDPKILLLDEATSALDTESEKIVQEALDKAREGRTTIVIAHRLSTIYNSNCIAVINKGEVSEKGTHLELIAQKGIYFRLNQYQLQEKDEDIKSRSLSPSGDDLNTSVTLEM